MQNLYNHLSINTLNFRIFITDKTLDNPDNSLGLPEYLGFNTNRYFNRKAVKEFIVNKVKEIIGESSIIVSVSDGGRQIDVFFKKEEKNILNNNILYEYNRKLINYDMFPVFENDVHKDMLEAIQ